MRRLVGTSCGVIAALVLAFLSGALFHGTANPVAVFSWLLQRYAYGSTVYPYNSVNAFNLYALRYPFWQPDTQALHLFGLAAGPLSLWGVALVLASSALIVGAYLQRRDERALLEGAMLCALAFFVLATRMHERYVYGAFLLAMPLVAFGRTGFWSAVTLTVTMFLNLAYSFAYQTAVEAKTPGVDATNLWPAISHPAALANCLLFAWLAYRYLGGTVPATAGAGVAGAPSDASRLEAWLAKARSWFDPREGVAAMTRLDWLLAAGFTLVSFVLCVMWVQYPAERYFDEIYYPRAGEEYLKGLDVSGWGPFEFTHPPFTKLLITASMLLFGGLHGLGDTGIGWRFLNVVVGALTVGLLYAFAKRLTSSTLFASVAAFLLVFDGFHYVQSRIATPEITVAFFGLLTLYAFYRLWISSGIALRDVPQTRAARTGLGVTMGIGTLVALALAAATPYLGPHELAQRDWPPSIMWSAIVMGLYVLTVFWLIARLVVVPRLERVATETSYAEGTRVRTSEGALHIRTLDPDGKFTDGDDELRRTIARDGTLTYATPAGTAVYRADGTADLAGTPARARDARIWWIVLAFAAAFAADSKWSDLFDIGIVWFVAALVFGQRFLKRPALYGNPFGVPVDLLIASIVVVGGVVYTLSYIPYFLFTAQTGGHHGFDDMVAMQHAMYRYHSTLVATHPYASQWWQWPLLLKPISYFWTDLRHNTADPNGCCVAEILALPNPFSWWLGLATVPIVGYLAWRERNKGYALLGIAYLLQWLPWAHSPRLMFEYHFYPNDAIILLADTIVLQRIWNARWTWGKYVVGVFLLVVLVAFIYFYPVLAGQHVTWNEWNARMWLPHWII